ncbi:sigma-70 family RNA polymerase sigma factor [Noviherbaspirillum cavernae]|uniref:Sigma-70 family RNA polymerase sigma factor n=1 Tax=Noviherbaspirillum cavernae TaxID=2320862 RepID=A0A418WV09_9BURK|nr:sigma-70 family RNA polymerase sigma factor [Noviherbaspirillum cavernae]RJF96493.1 sigma-70 family RNA polymerase sigma factor [Noviherbaspirillum cavernae]
MRSHDFDYEAQLFACARGEQAALRRLYDHESRWLLGVALRIVHRRELADEVLHEAFLQIWQKSATYNPALGSARGWIYSVVHHQAINVIRAQRSEASESDIDLENLPDNRPGLLEAYSKVREAGALHRCLELLDEQKRACILLAYVDGYSQSQIARHLACPLGTVKAWTRRGLMALKECLS